MSALTVSRQVVDQRGQEGDEHAGDDDVDDVEERLALDDQVEGDVLVLVALGGDVPVGVPLGRPVHNLPLAVLCQAQSHKRPAVNTTGKGCACVRASVRAHL